jgi:S1-C subfamily serine protease
MGKDADSKSIKTKTKDSHYMPAFTRIIIFTTSFFAGFILFTGISLVTAADLSSVVKGTTAITEITIPEPSIPSTSFDHVAGSDVPNDINNPVYTDFTDEEISQVEFLAEMYRAAIVYVRTDDGSQGTGFLIAPDVVITNDHVIESIFSSERGSGITINTFDGQTIRAELIVTDRGVDVAALRLATPIINVEPLKWSNTAPILGDTVMYVGNPSSIGSWFVGIGNVTDIEYGNVLSTLPVISGASGSPMMNMNGEVIAVISGIWSANNDPRIIEDVIVHQFLPATRVNGSGGSNVESVLQILEGKY